MWIKLLRFVYFEFKVNNSFKNSSTKPKLSNLIWNPVVGIARWNLKIFNAWMDAQTDHYRAPIYRLALIMSCFWSKNMLAKVEKKPSLRTLMHFLPRVEYNWLQNNILQNCPCKPFQGCSWIDDAAYVQPHHWKWGQTIYKLICYDLHHRFGQGGVLVIFIIIQ